MSKRPLKFMNLTAAIQQHKDFIRKVNRTKSTRHMRKVVEAATNDEIRLLQNIIISHFCDIQEVPINSHGYKKLKDSKKLPFIKKAFCPTRTLNAIKDARAILLKCLSVLKIFTRNISS